MEFFCTVPRPHFLGRALVWPGCFSTAVKRLSMREDLLGDRYIRFGKSIHMWLRLLAGKNRETFFVFQESSLAMNRKNKKNV